MSAEWSGELESDPLADVFTEWSREFGPDPVADEEAFALEACLTRSGVLSTEGPAPDWAAGVFDGISENNDPA